MCKHNDDRRILSVLQEPLALESQPFEYHAKNLGISVDQVLGKIQEYMRSGIIRRFAGIVKHNRAGYNYNAMLAFEVEDDYCDIAGEKLSEYAFISHCYRRSTYPDWPYNLYAMMHSHDELEFQEKLASIRDDFHYKSMIVLPSVKEFKKTRYSLQAENQK